MIEPYGTILKSMLHEFRELDLAIDSETDYKMVLSNKDYSLTVATERGFLTSLLACVTDKAGREFEVGLSERILDEQRFKAEITELEKIKNEYQLESPGGNEGLKSSGTYVYVKVAVRQVFSFIARFSQEILEENGPFRAEYRSREQMLLNDLGL